MELYKLNANKKIIILFFWFNFIQLFCVKYLWLVYLIFDYVKLGFIIGAK